MVCSFMKKAVAGAVLGVAALWMVSGTPAYNYMKTAWHAKWDCVQKNVPVDFQIADLRRQINDLESAMKSQIQNVAREEQQVRDLKTSLDRNQLALLETGKKLVAMRGSVEGKDVKLTGDGANNAATLRDLALGMDHYTILEQTAATQQTTLAKREEALTHAKEQLGGLKSKKSGLLSRLELIETQHRATTAANQGTQPGIDTSALTQIEGQVKELERRIKLQAREAELAQQFLADPATTAPAVDQRDIIGEIDAKFGKTSAKGDKSL